MRFLLLLTSFILASSLLALPGGTAGQTIVLENCSLIDGTGRAPIRDARIIVQDDRIRAVGKADAVTAPAGAERLDLGGRTVLPGLIDVHFHIENDPRLALRQLSYGVTTFRDPGEWLENFESLKQMMASDGLPGPRMSLCGPHIDGENPAYPEDAVVARDPEEARLQAERAIREGATAIKIYFRLPLASARAVIAVCRQRRVPCTAHLEILDARAALRAGLNGIEHITSVGTCLVPQKVGEQYRQAVLRNNAARRAGRYEIFAQAMLDGPDARELLQVLRERRPFVTPTLGAFEVREGVREEGETAEAHATRLRGWENMKRMTLLAHRNGARIVLGGHSSVQFGSRGEASLHELELLVESGLTPMEALRAATLTGAEFLFRARDLGSIERGKLADLLVVDGDPSRDISAMRRVERVMVGGRWIDTAKYRTY